MRTLRYTSAAIADLADIASHIAKASGDRELAQAFTSRLRRKCAHLAALPGLIGRARPELRPDIRSFSMQNYVLFFRYRDEVFEVVNILHARRDIDAYFADHEL